MPNKYTENFQLSQWEKADKVLMEDFNADNTKIDAALVVGNQERDAQTIAVRRNRVNLAVSDTLGIQSGGNTFASGLLQADECQEVGGDVALGIRKEPGRTGEIVRGGS